MGPATDFNPSARSLTGQYLCLFVSGVAGLVYEVLWSKYLALFVGSTGMAQVVVLCTFMGGLALGSHVLGRVADRVAQPLRFYAYLEFLIGVYALAFEPIFHLARGTFLFTVQWFGMSAGALAGAKVVACVMTLLVPTFLMGGTLPVLSRHMIRSTARVGPIISRLYFLNSLGAVVGCLLAGFFLIQALGLQFTMVTGAMLNIAAGLLALALNRFADAPAPEPFGAAEGKPVGVVVSAETDTDDPALPHRVIVLVLVCVAVSGGVSMMYEVAWIRLLTLVLGSSTYSFSLMLATFILGLSIGAFLLSFRKRTTGYGVIFGLSEVAVGLLVLLSLPFYVRLPYWFNQVASSLSREPSTFGLYQLCKVLLCALVMFLPTVLQGVTLPAATKILAKDIRSIGGRIGFIFAVNTAGTLVGAAYAGFVGMPALGIKGLLELAIGLNVVLGVAIVVSTTRPQERRWALPATLVAIVLVGGWYAVRMGSWDQEVFSAGLYRTRDRIPSFEEMQNAARERTTLYYRDGLYATVAVQDRPAPTHERMLVINGKVDASTGADLPTQKLLGHLPHLFHPNPKRVFIVGVGSGTTIGAALSHPSVERVDVVEISGEVIEASRLFEGVNGAYWKDPRVHVYREDAKTFLQVTDEPYDIIISEPTNPWIAGVAGVFSREYFEHCRNHLAEGGFFVQWVQGYELEDATFFLMLDTFASAFPHYTMWNPNASDTVLVGASAPYRPDFAVIDSRLAHPTVAADLSAIGISTSLPILAMQMADFATGAPHVPWLGAIHSDYFPILEYVAPRGFFVGSDAEAIQLLDERPRAPAGSSLWAPAYLESATPSESAFRETYAYILAYPGLFDRLGLAWVTAWAERFPDHMEARVARARLQQADHRHITGAFELQPAGPGDWRPYVNHLILERRFEDYEQSRTYLSPGAADELIRDLAWLETEWPESFTVEHARQMGILLYDIGQYEQAESYLLRAVGDRSARGSQEIEAALRTDLLICDAALQAGSPKRAAGHFEKHLQPYADLLEVRLQLSRILRHAPPPFDVAHARSR